ncbi:MAG: hypothetical protein AVDCRST_MAG54-923, partial [uncultured Actinomycetospora sp.]
VSRARGAPGWSRAPLAIARQSSSWATYMVTSGATPNSSNSGVSQMESDSM